MIRLLLLDIDGVLTDGRVALDERGGESKTLAYRDIDAVFQARREGLRVALITGEASLLVEVIARRLEVDTVARGAKEKAGALRQLCATMGVPLAETCYIGDGDRDAAALSLVGLGLAPADASAEARRSAGRVLAARGGDGAVAEALALIRHLNAEAAGASA